MRSEKKNSIVIVDDVKVFRVLELFFCVTPGACGKLLGKLEFALEF